MPKTHFTVKKHVFSPIFFSKLKKEEEYPWVMNIHAEKKVRQLSHAYHFSAHHIFIHVPIIISKQMMNRTILTANDETHNSNCGEPCIFSPDKFCCFSHQKEKIGQNLEKNCLFSSSKYSTKFSFFFFLLVENFTKTCSTKKNWK